jgi:CheY-like chemotaxis protein
MKIRVMVFEDNVFLRSMINEFLSRRGYEVVSFSDPADCPLLHSDACYYACADILISDLSMPNMTGLQFIENQIRKGCRIQNVALMSAAWTPQEREYAKQIGCQVFNKPFQFPELNFWLDECESRINPHRILTDELLHRKS